MRNITVFAFAALVLALVLPGRISAQGIHPAAPGAEVAATFSAERAEITPSTCNCFWFKGVSAQVSATFFHGFGVAAELTSGHAAKIAPGVDANKLAYLFGPRYTLDMNARGHSTQVFGEALFGEAHGFNSLFPGVSGSTTVANSFQLQVGGGAQVQIKGGLSFRVVEIDYVRTAFPNAGGNVQNDLKVASGLSYRIHRR